MKLTITVALTILLASGAFAQSNETELLRQQVEDQARQIESLQQRLERIERAIAEPSPAAPRLTSAVFVQPEPPRATPVAVTTTQAQQAQPAQAAQTLPQIAGFRLGADFRFRYDASIRSASA